MIRFKNRKGGMAKEFNYKSSKRKPCKQCRLCGKSGRSYKDIFKANIKMPDQKQNSENKLMNYSHKSISLLIQECLNFHVMKENQLSNIICTKCISELTRWSKFQNQCLQQQLSNGLESFSSKNDYIMERNNKTNDDYILSTDKTVDSEEVFNQKDKNLYIEDSQESKKKTIDKCSYCKSVFKNSNDHSFHKKTDKGCIFTCSQCNKEFRSKDILRNHMAVHSNTNSFCCHLCGLLFSTRNRLYHHLNCHEPIKRFQCSHCPKQFINGSDLEKHVRTHTGERPFKCSECDSHFTQYSMVVRHIEAVHKKTKRFTCSICSKSFLYKTHFSAHLMLHSGQKDMLCEVCNKSFVTKNALLRHQRNHTGEKPYPCPECGKRFADCSNRKRHVLQHHSTTKDVLDRPKKKGRIQGNKKTAMSLTKTNPLPTLRTFLEDPELLLGNLNDKRDDSLSHVEEISKNHDPSNVFNEFSENADNSEIPNDSLTLTVLEEEDNQSLEYDLLQYDNILPDEDENFLDIKNKLISNGMEQSENDSNKLEEFSNIFDQTEVEKLRLNSSVQCHNLTSADVLNLELALGTLSTDQVDIQQRWAADVLNNIAPCETQSILKMLNNQGTILLTFPDNEDFSV